MTGILFHSPILNPSPLSWNASVVSLPFGFSLPAKDKSGLKYTHAFPVFGNLTGKGEQGSCFRYYSFSRSLCLHPAETMEDPLAEWPEGKTVSFISEHKAKVK